MFQSSALTYYNFRALGVRIGELHSHNLRDLLFETGPSHMVQADTHVPTAGVLELQTCATTPKYLYYM